MRIEIVNRPVARAYSAPGCEVGIGAFWHRHMIPIAAFFCRLNAVVMVSHSRDGELIARAVARTPLSTVRGSSSRGGREALERMVEALRGGRPGAFACDGPRGPALKVKMGVVTAARRAGVPIIPIACAARRAAILRSWDRTVLPFPGTRIIFGFGDPIPVAPEATQQECEQIRARLEELLHALDRLCDRRARA